MSPQCTRWCRRQRFAAFCVYGLTFSLLVIFIVNFAEVPTRICLFCNPAVLSSLEARDHRGAVASVSATCSTVGINIIKHGGNAADAAVAVEFCIGVVAPNLTGLGGGGFLLVRAENGSYEFVDFRESAPAAASEEMYSKNINDSLTGGLASGIPGELRGLEYLHARYGTLPWATLIQPSIDLARAGHAITGDLARAMDMYDTTNFLIRDPSWAQDFAPHGVRLGEGDRLERRRYADMLETIASQGPGEFYTGAIAAATIRALTAKKGVMTVADLESYQIIKRPTLKASYHNYTITSCGAPGSGAVVIQVMKIMEGYNDDNSDPQLSNLQLHRLVEAIRFGYAARTHLGDPTVVKNVTSYEHAMIDDSTIAKLRSRIMDSHTMPVSHYNPDKLEILETHGTSHLSAADSSGLAVALTSTINLDFGSQLMVPETGLIMNNEMNDFSVLHSKNAFGFNPSPENFIRPGKRPQSSMAPTIVEFEPNKTLYAVVGADGGSRIITAVIQTLWNTLEKGLTALDAVGMPRFHDQLSPNEMSFEYPYNNDTVEYMRQKQHNVTWENIWNADAHVVKRLSNGTFEAAGDPRLLASGGYAI